MPAAGPLAERRASPGGSRGTPITSIGTAKRAMVATVSSRLAPGRRAFAHHHAGDVEIALRQHMQRRQRVADGAEIAAGHQQHRDAQRRHPVEHGVGSSSGTMMPPTPSMSSVPRAVGGVARELHQRVEIDGAAFAPRRQVGRQRRGEAPGRDALDLVGC